MHQGACWLPFGFKLGHGGLRQAWSRRLTEADVTAIVEQALAQ